MNKYLTLIGLLACSKCACVWERDKSATVNIVLKALHILKELKLPYFWRYKSEIPLNKKVETTGTEVID